MTTATATTVTTVRAALLQARANLDDALDLLDEVDDLPAKVVERMSGAARALAEALGEMGNAPEPSEMHSAGSMAFGLFPRE